MDPGHVALVFGLAMAGVGVALCLWAAQKWVRARGAGNLDGRRLRAVNTLIAGVLLLVVGAASLFAAGPQRLRQLSPVRHLPLSYLLARAQGGRENAAAELYRRAMSGDLDAASLARIVRLAMTAEEAMDWASLLRALTTEDRIDESVFEALWGEGAWLHLDVRPAVRVGDALPWRVRADGAIQRAPAAEVRVRALQLPGRSSAAGPAGEPRPLAELLRGTWLGGRISTADVAPGEQAVACEVEIVLERSAFLGGIVRPAQRFRRTLEDRVRLVPREAEDPLHAVSEPAAAQLRERIAVTRSYAARRDDGRPLLGVSLRVSGPCPAPLACEVLLRGDSGELALGRLTCPRGGEAAFSGTAAAPDSGGPWRYELVLRGSADAARATIDMLEYWAGELSLGTIEFMAPVAMSPADAHPLETDEAVETQEAETD